MTAFFVTFLAVKWPKKIQKEKKATYNLWKVHTKFQVPSIFAVPFVKLFNIETLKFCAYTIKRQI